MSRYRNTVTLLTPPGVGAIAVVRICGPDTAAALGKHLSRTADTPNRCVHGNLTDGDRVIDDIVVVRIAPDVFDLNTHGGTWVVRSVIELFVRHGFIVTEESPEPEDSLLQQEIVASLRNATTSAGLRMLQVQESLWKQVQIGARLGKDVLPILRNALSDRTLDRLLHPPRVAIVGPANVGKSTLANQQFGTNRSITADVQGTTRDWVGALANIDDLPVMLLDTPGIRATADAIEHAAIHASGRQIEQSEMIVVVIDATRTLDEQRELLEKFHGATIVVNKSDQAPAMGIEFVGGIHTVATTGEGVDTLRDAIKMFFCGSSVPKLTAPSIWTARQREIVERAIDDLSALEVL
jgi:tRNA modification GTPase